MSMNKKEKALLESLKVENSLRFTAEILPDVPPPDGCAELTKGYLFNEYSLRVEKACSSSIYHSTGRDDKTTSQGTRELFSTELLALKAMRHVIELKCARELRAVDILIENNRAEALPEIKTP